jgi:hypothetical protein
MTKKGDIENEYALYKTFFHRLLITICYTFVNQIKASIREKCPNIEIENVLVSFMIMLLLGIFNANIVKIKGIQTTFSILFADIFTGSLVLVKEPTSYVIVPSILLYICNVNMIMACIYDNIVKNRSKVKSIEELWNSTNDFVILYIVSRCIKYIQDIQHMNLLYIFSFCYLWIPTNFRNNTQGVSTFERNTMKTLESLCARGCILLLTIKVFQDIGISKKIDQVIMEYVIIHLINHIHNNKKIKLCGEFLVLAFTQQTINSLSNIISAMISCCIYLTTYIMLVSNRLCPHLGCKCSRVGASLTFITIIQEYMTKLNKSEEKSVVYLVLIVCIEIVIERIERYERQQNIKNKNEKENVEKQIEVKNKNVHVIENSNSALGLPIINEK